MSVDDYSDCPTEVKEIILDILSIAAISIRIAGWNGDAEYCALEADHIHNLPSLLKYYNAARLRYYLKAECPSYLKLLEKSQRKIVRRYDDHWQRLQKYI